MSTLDSKYGFINPDQRLGAPPYLHLLLKCSLMGEWSYQKSRSIAGCHMTLVKKIKQTQKKSSKTNISIYFRIPQFHFVVPIGMLCWIPVCTLQKLVLQSGLIFPNIHLHGKTWPGVIFHQLYQGSDKGGGVAQMVLADTKRNAQGAQLQNAVHVSFFCSYKMNQNQYYKIQCI